MSEISQLLGDRNQSLCKGISADPSVRMAYHHLLNGDLEGAEKRFQRILGDNAEDPEALAGLAICIAQGSSRFVSATKLANRAVRLAPKSPAGYYALGIIHLLGSKLEQGYRYLMKAKHLAPKDPRVDAGFELFDQGRDPVISDLSREHPLNRALGRVRSVLEAPIRMLQSGTVSVKSQPLRARAAAER